MNEQIHNLKRRLQNVEDCVRNNVFLCAFILWNLERRTISRFFWNIKVEHIDKNNFYACDNSFNYNKNYFIYDFFVSNPTRLAIRPLASFCAFKKKRISIIVEMKAMFLIGGLLNFALKHTQFFRNMKNWVWKAYKMDKRWDNSSRLGTILLFHLKKAMKKMWTSTFCNVNG